MTLRLMDAASRVAPRATVRAATAAMLVPGRRMRTRPEQAEVMRRARRDVVQAGPHRVVVHRWGSEPRRVLLVHGWKGRAAQWAALVARLEGEATVVAFDAPAHGESRGMVADIGMWIETMRALEAEAGGFDVVVAHSFGALAALRARRAGLLRGAIVAIAAPPTADAVFGAYAAQAGLSDAVADGIAASLSRRLGPVMSAIAMGDFAAAGSADAELLVIQDRGDRVVPPAAARAVAASWAGPSTVVMTEGEGHNRILAAPEVLDAVQTFARPRPARDLAPAPAVAAGTTARW